MSSPVRLLVVEDDENKQWLLSHYTAKTIPNSACVVRSSGAAAIEYLQEHPVDAIITDHRMAPVSGIELIKWVRARQPSVPIILVTGHPAIEREALEAGATLVLGTHRFAEIGEYLLPLLAKAAPLSATPPAA